MPSTSSTFLTALVAASLAMTAQANYTLVDSFEGDTFFDSFSFFEDPDPTNGFVDYVGFDSAISNKLVGLVNGTNGRSSVYLGADFESKATQPGRKSVRVQSDRAWTHGLLVVDIEASPVGNPSLWPALWLLAPPQTPNGQAPVWPGDTGEIDIFEGWNDHVANAMTLHTSAGCALKNDSESFSGTMVTSNCDVNDPSQPKNAGCSIMAPKDDSVTLHGTSRSYATAGESFNKQGGGVYVMLWESEGLTFWFYPPGYMPADIAAGTPNPSTWDQKPVARFTGCDFDSHLRNLSVVINLTFCGAVFSGGLWESSGSAARTGASSCEAYVENTPEAFENAYWLINSIKMYQNSSDAGSHVKRNTELSPRSALIPTVDLAERAHRRIPVAVLESSAISLRAGIEQTGATETLILAIFGSVIAVVSAFWFS